MRNERIVEIRSDVERIEKKFDQLLKKLGSFEDSDNRAFDISKTIPNTDSSVSDIRARHAATAGLVRKLDPKGSTIAPLSFFTAATNTLRSISNAQDKIESDLLEIDKFGGLKSIDYQTFMSHCGNGTNRDLAAPFKTLFDNSESFLTAFYDLFNAINPSRAAFNFSSATKSLRDSINQSAMVQASLKTKLSEAETALRKIHEEEEVVSTAVSRANELASTIAESQGRSSELVGEIVANTDRIREIVSDASSLQSTVVEYSETFDSFDNKLSAREKKIASGSSQLEQLTDRFAEKETYIDGIIAQSDNMLSGATVAGLSSEFKNIRDDLTEQVENARSNFNWAITFLFASAIPLIIFIFSPIIGPLISDDERLLTSIASAGSEKSGWQYVGQVIARFIILLPAIWFVTFATGRYNSLFRLREHYSYKYSMAVAVEGFKKQAPGHEDMIAALVFEQLAFNPADKIGKQPEGPESPPNPIAKLLLNSLRKDGKSEDN